jgi:hypothetical protein
MKSVSLSLTKNSLMKDYAKVEKIKSRIARYTMENNKLEKK